jgi:type IV secretion system protein VirB10
MPLTPLHEIPLEPTPVAYGGPPTKTPAELALERQLSGLVFSSQSSLPIAPMAGSMPPPSVPQEPGELSTLLRPAMTAAVRAQVLPTQRLLLPKGAFLDCTLETAIDSTLPGMTTCVMATDAFGVDGEVVLLERGTKLVGETRGQVQQGSARVFVLWNEARTPTGVIVPLASPGADELGRAGLPGVVDRHFWERFGAAMLVSVIDGAIQTAVQSTRGGNGTVIVNPSATQDVMTEVLKGTINIPPTVVKHQGDRIQVLVARDLDFRSVYELKSTVAGR